MLSGVSGVEIASVMSDEQEQASDSDNDGEGGATHRFGVDTGVLGLLARRRCGWRREDAERKPA